QLVIAWVSNVLGKFYAYNPLVKTQKKGLPRRRLAEHLQVIRQMILPGNVGLMPHVSFDKPIRYEDIKSIDGVKGKFQAILKRAEALLKTHREKFDIKY
ncbi:MAG: hypothetical protein N2D54_03155, partial [Chloroflexota bacterium]